MDAKEFKNKLELINEKFDSNCIAVEHRKNKMFVMPISQIVSLNRDGLVIIHNSIKKMKKMGYIFEKI